MAKKKQTAIFHRKTVVVGKTRQYELEDIPVVLMAIAEGYAMVRRPGCAPFVVREKELTIDKEGAK